MKNWIIQYKFIYGTGHSKDPALKPSPVVTSEFGVTAIVEEPKLANYMHI